MGTIVEVFQVIIELFKRIGKNFSNELGAMNVDISNIRHIFKAHAKNTLGMECASGGPLKQEELQTDFYVFK